MSNAKTDPFAVLGIVPTASDDQVRTRYLELVREHSPETSPEKFQQIHLAYQAASDPLLVARQLLNSTPEIESWQALLERQQADPPRIATEVLLSFGNCQSDPASSTDQGTDQG